MNQAWTLMKGVKWDAEEGWEGLLPPRRVPS